MFTYHRSAGQKSDVYLQEEPQQKSECQSPCKCQEDEPHPTGLICRVLIHAESIRRLVMLILLVRHINSSCALDTECYLIDEDLGANTKPKYSI